LDNYFSTFSFISFYCDASGWQTFLPENKPVFDLITVTRAEAMQSVFFIFSHCLSLSHFLVCFFVCFQLSPASWEKKQKQVIYIIAVLR